MNYVSFILAGLLSLGSFLAGWSFNGNRWEAKFNSYKSGIEQAVADQKAKTSALVKKQEEINKSTKETYENRIAALKSYYGGVQYKPSSASAVSSVPEPTKGTPESPSDLALTCALTTQQLISLQDWVINTRKEYGKDY